MVATIGSGSRPGGRAVRALLVVEQVGVALGAQRAGADEDRVGRGAQLAQQRAVGGMAEPDRASLHGDAAVGRGDHRRHARAGAAPSWSRRPSARTTLRADQAVLVSVRGRRPSSVTRASCRVGPRGRCRAQCPAGAGAGSAARAGTAFLTLCQRSPRSWSCPRTLTAGGPAAAGRRRLRGRGRPRRRHRRRSLRRARRAPRPPRSRRRRRAARRPGRPR